MLFDALLGELGHDGRQNSGRLPRRDLVEHLHNGNFATALEKVFGALGAHKAASDDRDLAGQLGPSGENVPGRDDLIGVRARHGDGDVVRADGDDGGVGGVHVLGRGRVAEDHLHAEAGQDLLVVLDGAQDLVLARGRGGEVDLAAEALGRLVERHVIASLRADPRRLEPGDAAAHDGDLLPALARLDGDRGLIAVLGVEHARDVAAPLDGVDAALVAVEALADGLAQGSLERDVGVAEKRASISDDVCRAVGEYLLAGLDRDDAADRGHGNRDDSLHALGHRERPVVRHGAHRRDGVAHVARVVGLRHLDHVDASALEELRELARLVGKKPALAARGAVGVLHDHGQLVLEHERGRGFFDGGDDLKGIADAVLEDTAVLVLAVVERGRAERAHEAVAMDLDGIDTRLLGTGGRRGNGVLDLGKLLGARLVDEVLHVVVQLGVGVARDLLGLGGLGGEGLLVAGGLGLLRRLRGHAGAHDHAADARHVILGVEELQAELGPVLVDGLGERLERRDLGVVGELGRGARGHDGGNVADDDVSHPALGQALVEREAARSDGPVALLVARGERREHDTVLEFDGPDLDRLQEPACRICHFLVLSYRRPKAR